MKAKCTHPQLCSVEQIGVIYTCDDYRAKQELELTSWTVYIAVVVLSNHATLSRNDEVDVLD